MQDQYPSAIEVVTIGDCTLILGDATEIVKEIGGADVTVTDPPYGINGSNGTIGEKRAKGAYTADFPDTPDHIRWVIAPIFTAALEKTGRAALTPGGTCSGYYPNPTAIGGYVQRASSGLCKWGACTLQPIFYYGRDPRVGKTITPITYELYEAPPKLAHPCPKPTKAWGWLVSKVSLPGETVFDPFMGSGTTGVVCVQQDRKFIGVEIHKEYFDIAVARIREAHSQPKLFPVSKLKPRKTADMFK